MRLRLPGALWWGMGSLPIMLVFIARESNSLREIVLDIAHLLLLCLTLIGAKIARQYEERIELIQEFHQQRMTA